MDPIKVFNREHKDGLGDLIQMQGSILLRSQAKASIRDNFKSKELIKKLRPEKIVAGLEDIVDLYHLESILVTAGVKNLNDEFFIPADVMAARKTPINKPFNLMHNEFDIIGHMISSEPVDDDYNLIAYKDEDEEEEEELEAAVKTEIPDKFHLLTGAVIYTHWRDEERQDNISKIIAEIPDDLWYVSMECLAPHFDYAIINPDGVSKIVARTEESSFLSKYLRAYKGTGIYQGHKIARAPRDFIFSGKGLVDNPANPESEIVKPSTSTSVAINKEIILAGEMKMEVKDETNYIQTIASLEKEIKDLKIEAGKSNETKLVAEVTELKASVTKLEADKTALSTELTEVKASVVKAEAALEASDKSKTEFQAEVTTLKAEKLVASRLADLVGKGVEAVKAQKLVDTFKAYSDEEFAVVAELAIPVKVVAETKEVINVEASKKVDSEPLTDVEPTVEVTLAAVNDEPVAKSKETINFMAGYLGSGTSNRKARQSK